MSTSEIATVLAWHDALNASDVDTLVGLSSPDIEVGSSDGADQGLDHLRAWARETDIALEPGRMFYGDGVVVAEESGGGAASFRVVDDHVTSIFRHPDLASALSSTGLSEADLVD